MKIKKILGILAVLGTMGLTAVANAATVGYVDVSKVYYLSIGERAVSDEILKLGSQLVDSPGGRAALKASANGDIRSSAEKLSLDEQLQLILAYKKAHEEIREFLEPTTEKYKQAVAEVAKEKHLDAVINAIPGSSVPYVAKEDAIVDITNAVLDKMNHMK